MIGAVSGANFVGKNFSMVLVGGGLEDDNTEVWDTVISLGGGVGVSRFGVISAASENPCCDEDSSWVYYRDLLTRYGAAEVYYIPVTVDSKEFNSNPEVVAHVKTLTGFFFGGGDQSRIVSSFYNNEEREPSPVLSAIKWALLSSGGVVAGTSAGTDVQTSKVMIAGGDSYPGLVEGSLMIWNTRDLPADESVLSGYGPGGIGNFEYGLLDTHFANRGRQGRLIELLLDSESYPTGAHLAFGVDENTALVVTGDWRARVGTVIGQRGVIVFDSSRAAIDPSEGGMHCGIITGVGVTRLSHGDVLSFNSFSVSVPPYKLPLEGREDYPSAVTSKDIFQEGTFQFDVVTESLFRSPAATNYGVTLRHSPQIMVEVGKRWPSGNETSAPIVAVGYGGVNPSTNEYEYSYTNMWLNMKPL